MIGGRQTVGLAAGCRYVSLLLCFGDDDDYHDDKDDDDNVDGDVNNTDDDNNVEFSFKTE